MAIMIVEYAKVVFKDKVYLVPRKLITPPFLSAQAKIRKSNIIHKNIEYIDFTIVELTALTDALYNDQTIGDL